VGEDPHMILDFWDCLAGWYVVKTDLDNSTLFLPLEGERSDDQIINDAHLDSLTLSSPRSTWYEWLSHQTTTVLATCLDPPNVFTLTTPLS